MVILYISSLFLLLVATSVPQNTDAEELEPLPMPDYCSCNFENTDELIDCRMIEKPKNSNNSIQYLLFTIENRHEPCFIEPTIEDISRCTFNPKYRTIFLIHGYITKLKPGNVYEKIKDSLLTLGKYNVIIVNWSRYNQPPYCVAWVNSFAVGKKIGDMIKFLVENKDINPKNVYLIGHSLGAHVAGKAGKEVFNLGRISGIDPAAPRFLSPEAPYRLDHTDADFVDIIHSSNYKRRIGYGIHEPIGDIDFYPNGGSEQPACQYGGNYTSTDGDVTLVQSKLALRSCNHDISLLYFLTSILSCDFLSLQYNNYQDYKMRNSSEHQLSNKMGLNAYSIPSLPPKSRFYLKTTAYYPYCKTSVA